MQENRRTSGEVHPKIYEIKNGSMHGYAGAPYSQNNGENAQWEEEQGGVDALMQKSLADFRRDYQRSRAAFESSYIESADYDVNEDYTVAEDYPSYVDGEPRELPALNPPSEVEVLLEEILLQMQELTAVVKDMQTKTAPPPPQIEAPLRGRLVLQEEGWTNAEPPHGSRARLSREMEKRVESPLRNESPPAKHFEEPHKKPGKKLRWLNEVAFYLVLAAMIFGAFLLRSNGDGRPASFAGYSLFTVLTSSMESEIPKGSLVITKTVDPETLQVGDDITYMANQTATITHRIISITESYLDTGARAFETQGVMNKEPDKNLVPAVNVIGKVVFHSKVLGQIASFLTNNWPYLIFVLVIVFVLSAVWKWVMKKDDHSPDAPKRRGKSK